MGVDFHGCLPFAGCGLGRLAGAFETGESAIIREVAVLDKVEAGLRTSKRG